MVFLYVLKGLKCVELNFYFQQWALLFQGVHVQTPDPALRPISHFHSCSSPCGLHLKIAKRGKGGLNFTRWWQIYSSITGEGMSLCTCMTILHTSDRPQPNQTRLNRDRKDGGCYYKVLCKFIKVKCCPQAVAAVRGVIIGPPAFPVSANDKCIVFCFNFPWQGFVPQVFSCCDRILGSHGPSVCCPVTWALSVGDTLPDRCLMSHNKGRDMICGLSKWEAL